MIYQPPDSDSPNALAHGPQKYAVFASAKLNDEFAKATVARLLRSNEASCWGSTFITASLKNRMNRIQEEIVPHFCM